MKTPQHDTEKQFEADIAAAYEARFPTEHHALPAVQSFFEVRGQHNRGRVGDCLLVTSWKNAKRAVSGQ
jgi:hypothetical protein